MRAALSLGPHTQGAPLAYKASAATRPGVPRPNPNVLEIPRRYCQTLAMSLLLIRSAAAFPSTGRSSGGSQRQEEVADAVCLHPRACLRLVELTRVPSLPPPASPSRTPPTSILRLLCCLGWVSFVARYMYWCNPHTKPSTLARFRAAPVSLPPPLAVVRCQPPDPDPTEQLLRCSFSHNNPLCFIVS
jgi:hypothetical protein